jgi:hypothetical protein
MARQRVGINNEGLSSLNDFDKKTNSTKLIWSASFNTLYNNTVLNQIDKDNLNSFKERILKENEVLRERNMTLENEIVIMQTQIKEIETERNCLKEMYNTLNSTKKTCPDSDKNNNYAQQSSNNKPANANMSNDLNKTDSSFLENLSNAKSDDPKYVLYREYRDDPVINDLVINKSQIKGLFKKIDDVSANLKNVQNIKSPSEILLVLDVVKELKKITETLLESLNDKVLANKHQRKVNKILATRINDLENEIKCYSQANSEKSSVFQDSKPDLDRSLIKFDDCENDKLS